MRKISSCLINLTIKTITKILAKSSCQFANVLNWNDTFVIFNITRMIVRVVVNRFENIFENRIRNAQSTRNENMICCKNIVIETKNKFIFFSTKWKFDVILDIEYVNHAFSFENRLDNRRVFFVEKQSLFLSKNWWTIFFSTTIWYLYRSK